MGLLPLEFTDCLSDSPYFRENLHAHERELDQTSQQIKGLIKQVKELVDAAKILSRAQRNFANTLSNFTFECIGTERTDDEIVIAGSLKEFARLLNTIEDERDRMLDRVSSSFIHPIEEFRVNQIGVAKEGKKKFDKETAKFCISLERHLNLSTKKSENSLQEADANLGMEQRHFVQASLEYILKLQEVQERKKFEFVETILSFMYGWLTFYHQGHEVAKDFKSFMTDLQVRLQRTRDNYNATQYEAENLMLKMLEARKTKPQDPGTLNKMYTRQGYLFLLEKKAFGTSHWIKHFCQYQKDTRRFTMIPYNQTAAKIHSTDTITLKECVRRMSDSIDKRFCFDVIPEEKPNTVYTFQALSEEDRKLWLEAMDGQDPPPTHLTTSGSISGGSPSSEPTKTSEECSLDDLGFAFVSKCIEWMEERGLEDQGLYRIGGVASRVNRLIQGTLDRRKLNPETGLLDVDTSSEDWEIRTVTSALKQFFRNLPEPLMSYRLHQAFITAAKQKDTKERMDLIHCLIHELPQENFDMLHLLMSHLKRVSEKSDKNLMTISNLSVCFGPTLLRPEDESMSQILDIKFANVVVEILIENCDTIFKSKPAEGLSAARIAATMAATSAARPSVASVSPTPFGGRGPVAAVASAVGQVFRSSSQDQLPSQTRHHSLHPPYGPVTRVSHHQQIQHPNHPPPLPPLNPSMNYSNSQQPFVDHLPSSSSSYHFQPLKPAQSPHIPSSVVPPPANGSSSFISHQSIYPQGNHFHQRTNSRPVGVYQPAIGGYPPSNSLISSLTGNNPYNSTTLPLSVNNSSNHQGSSLTVECTPSSDRSSSTDSSLDPGVISSSLPSHGGTPASSTSSHVYATPHPPPSSSSYGSNGRSMSLQPSSSAAMPLQQAHLPHQQHSLNTPSSSSSMSGNLPPPGQPTGRRVRALYNCVGENPAELSFEPNAIIYNVRQSKEPGWLEGTYRGRTGLIPENYVQPID